MANFEQAFQLLMKEERLSLSNNPNDRGGQTYAGIARRFHPDWEGWKHIDQGVIPPTELVRIFYRANYWAPVQGDRLEEQRIAEVLFSQYVNMGVTAIKLAQTVVGVTADGVIGPKTLQALNDIQPAYFQDRFCIAMMARYLAIGLKDKSQRAFWPGWFSRALRIAS